MAATLKSSTSRQPMSVQVRSDQVLMEARDLHVHFHVRKGLFQRQTIYALNGIDLLLKRGETVAVVGESGSGKTTLGRALLQLVKPAQGEIWFDGDKLAGLDTKQLQLFRRKAQPIFQDPYSSINPYMNIEAIVEEPLLIHNTAPRKERQERVWKALEDVGLRPVDAFTSNFPHTLSGGQRQRVGIARALVLEPTLIVADEPVSMIDASSRAEILYLMHHLQQQYGIAFLYITHDIASARHFSDELVVMYLGTIVERGAPGEVVRDPLHPYTRSLIEAVPEPDPSNRLRERNVIAGESPNSTAIPSGCPFHTRCPQSMNGLCDNRKPALLPTGDNGRLVACFLYDNVGREWQKANA